MVRPIVLLACLLLMPPASAAQQPTDELRALRKDIEKIQKDLQEIKDLLRGRAAAPAPEPPPNLRLSVDGDAIKGSRTARLALIDFTDYQ